jgi:FtsZ-binding cell division protein ZapB
MDIIEEATATILALAKEIKRLHQQVTALEARNKELAEALEGVTDSLGGSYEQHAIRKRIQDLLGEVK